VITTSTAGRTGAPPARPAGFRLLASVDVEWTKNYKIKNGNVPFCYSVVYLQLPTTLDIVDTWQISYTSHYVETPAETGHLVAAAAADIRRCLEQTDLVVGHQLSSDLAVLRATAAVHHEAREAQADLDAARAAWHARRTRIQGSGQIFDTRYDNDSVLTGSSRRLVDVCGDLGLDVTQPELRGTSMTALHRRWLDSGEPSARERITVLNLRHSLSAALVALIATGARPTTETNVNQLLAAHLPPTITWARDPAFTALLTTAAIPGRPQS